MNELEELLNSLSECGNFIMNAAAVLKKYLASAGDDASGTEVQEIKEPEPAKEVKTYTKEEVRALLSAKAGEADGKYKTAVKALVTKYANGGTLKDVTPDNYAALVAELEVMTNG